MQEAQSPGTITGRGCRCGAKVHPSRLHVKLRIRQVSQIFITADLAVVSAEIPVPQSADERAAITIAGAHLMNCIGIPALEHGRSLSRSAAIACNPIQGITSMLIRDESNVLPESKGEDIKRMNGIVLSFTGLNSVRSRLDVDPAQYLEGINFMHAAVDRLSQRLRTQRRAEAPMRRRSFILHRLAIATPPT